MLAARRQLTALFDSALDAFQDVPSSLGWAHAFNGAMVPVTNAENIELQLKSGSLPKDLAGAYMRVGPNAQHWPPAKRTHVFDGDGMVHAVRIKDGKAVYHCRFLETPKYLFEKEYGKEWFSRIGEFHGKSGLVKVLTVVRKKRALAGMDYDFQTGTGNTAIGYTPDGKLWALNEGGAPFRFRLDEAGIPQSLGFDTLGNTLLENMSAHPKFDQKTGEIFFHGRNLGQNFYAGRVVDGKLTDRVEIKMKDGFHHDMFITEKYMVLIDGAQEFTPAGLVKKLPLWNFQKDKPLRFGVLPRDTKEWTADAFTWIEASDAAEIVHTLYACDEEDDKIVLWTPVSYYEEGAVDGVLGGMGPIKMRRVVIDLKAKTVDIQKVEGGDEYRTEFPRIRDDRIGLRTRYGYSGLQTPTADFDFRGIMKWDFKDCKRCGVINLPENMVGGEPVFLPRAGGEGKEDDYGYIAMLVWNEVTCETSFLLYDAQTFSPTPVTELIVPRRVPLGFHVAWIDEKQFQEQLKTN